MFQSIFFESQIKSGRLQWSPVHKSEKFWRENAQKFNEKDFELLKYVHFSFVANLRSYCHLFVIVRLQSFRILIKILEVQTDTLALCVAAHDIGEYVRHYPRGKKYVAPFLFLNKFKS